MKEIITTDARNEYIRDELKTLLMIAENWQKSDLAYAECDGTEKHVYTDYAEKLAQWMLPYVKRMKEVDAITEEEHNEFCQKLAVLTDELRWKLRLPAPDSA
jgi:hypothetical protein